MLELMIERYRMLCCRFATTVLSRHSTAKRIHVTLFSIMLFALLYSLPRYFEFYVEYVPKEAVYLTNPSSLVSSKVYVIGYRIIGGVLFYSALPYILIFLISAKIWQTTAEATRSRTQMKATSPREKENLNSERILFAITVKFLVSRFAATLFDIVEHFVGADVFVNSAFAMLCVYVNNLMVVISSALNFFIFLYFSTAFKKSVAVFLPGFS